MKKSKLIYELEEILLKLPEGFICSSAQNYIFMLARKLKKEDIIND